MSKSKTIIFENETNTWYRVYIFDGKTKCACVGNISFHRPDYRKPAKWHWQSYSNGCVRWWSTTGKYVNIPPDSEILEAWNRHCREYNIKDPDPS